MLSLRIDVDDAGSLAEAIAAYNEAAFETAFERFSVLAEAGDPDASMWLGAMHAHGDGVAASLPDAGAVEAIPIHHKPGHHGGPPWLRGDRDRGDWRDGRYDERSYTVCRNTYRTYYDPYYGEYVRRRVRICD